MTDSEQIDFLTKMVSQILEILHDSKTEINGAEYFTFVEVDRNKLEGLLGLVRMQD